MLYYRIKDNRLYDYANYSYDNDCLQTDIITQEELSEHPNKVIVQDGVLVLNPNYEDEETAKREANFKTQFFEVENYGWYRRVPKGYGSAVESMNVLFNIASVSQGIQAGLIIFYETPDFSDPEQCTEEWLVQHQIVMPAMTLQEFMQLYIAFMTAWNTQEHIEGIE